MQVFYYGNTGFGAEDLLCMLLKGVCYFYHSPKNGPDRSIYAIRGVMLIEGILIEGFDCNMIRYRFLPLGTAHDKTSLIRRYLNFRYSKYLAQYYRYASILT